MANDKTYPSYKIRLLSPRGEPFDDVIYCACIRAPFLKKASYWILKINTTSLWAQQLFNDLSSPTNIQLKLEIYEKTDESKDDIDSMTKIRSHFCTCIEARNAANSAQINLTDQNTEAILILVDHFLLDMSLKSNFNKNTQNKTAYDTIKSYQDKLKEIYGDVFWFNHLIDDENINKTEYENILTTVSDIQITDYLLYNRNALNNISFYFFDDFCLDKDLTQGYIAGQLIDLSNKDKLKKFDIGKYSDTLMSSNIIKVIPVKDVFGNLTKGFDSFVFKTKYMFSKIDSELTKVLYYPKLVSVTESEHEILEGRTSKISLPDSIKFDNKTENSLDKRQRSMTIYVPDNKEDAKKRLENFKVFFNSRVKQLVEIQTDDCFCDWLQFGYIYTFDQFYKDQYIFTPISICNIFYKDSREFTTRHLTRSLMIEYYRDDAGKCGSCKYFDSGAKSCTLHLYYATENDRCFDFTSS